MGRARARQRADNGATGAPPPSAAPPPTATRNDGSAVWEVDPFLVSGHPAAGIDAAVVVLDGRATSPDTALALADALRAAALRAKHGPGNR